jgi:CHAT domain-containing protein
VVISRWTVDCASTTSLVVEFSRRLRDGAGRGMAPDEALRGAALALLRTPAYRHPFYWAPFSVIGA